MAVSAKNKVKHNDELLKKVSGNNITALYVRVSTDFQYEEGYSLEAQIKKLTQWCELKDYHSYQVYQDGGWSGSNINRPAMEKMIGDIKQKHIKRVVVYKLDRLSRSQKDTLYLLEEVFIPNNVEFISINENFDTSSPYGKAMIGILSVFAQLERENIRERTRMGMYERVKDGWWIAGGRNPFGYTYDPNQNILVPNEHADEVRQIFELYLQGYSMNKLAAMFPVANDRHIANIIKRRAYIGEIEYRGEIFTGRHQAIIDKETWERAQLEFQRRSTKDMKRTPYLLSGLLVCGKCGAKMRYQKWSNGEYKIWCYSQDRSPSKKYLVKDSNCDNLRCDAAAVEKAVIEDLLKVSDMITIDKFPKARQNIKTSGIDSLKARQNAVELKLKRLYALYGESGDSLLMDTIKETRNDLDSINRLIKSEMVNVELGNHLKENWNAAKNLRNKWGTLSFDAQRRIIRMCIEKVIITGGKIEVKYMF